MSRGRGRRYGVAQLVGCLGLIGSLGGCAGLPTRPVRIGPVVEVMRAPERDQLLLHGALEPALVTLRSGGEEQHWRIRDDALLSIEVPASEDGILLGEWPTNTWLLEIVSRHNAGRLSRLEGGRWRELDEVLMLPYPGGRRHDDPLRDPWVAASAATWGHIRQARASLQDAKEPHRVRRDVMHAAASTTGYMTVVRRELVPAPNCKAGRVYVERWVPSRDTPIREDLPQSHCANERALVFVGRQGRALVQLRATNTIASYAFDGHRWVETAPAPPAEHVDFGPDGSLWITDTSMDLHAGHGGSWSRIAPDRSGGALVVLDRWVWLRSRNRDDHAIYRAERL